MSQNGSSQYLQSKVLTASQPELQVMLLEGGLRFGRQALTGWDEMGWAEVEPLLDKTMQIIEELVQGVAGGSSELSQQFEEQYSFAYRSLASCRINQDKDQLLRTLDLLSYQRQTWKLAMDKMAQDSSEPADKPSAPAAIAPHFGSVQTASPGLSLEA